MREEKGAAGIPSEQVLCQRAVPYRHGRAEGVAPRPSHRPLRFTEGKRNYGDHPCWVGKTQIQRGSAVPGDRSPGPVPLGRRRPPGAAPPPSLRRWQPPARPAPLLPGPFPSGRAGARPPAAPRPSRPLLLLLPTAASRRPPSSPSSTPAPGLAPAAGRPGSPPPPFLSPLPAASRGAHLRLPPPSSSFLLLPLLTCGAARLKTRRRGGCGGSRQRGGGEDGGGSVRPAAGAALPLGAGGGAHRAAAADPPRLEFHLPRRRRGAAARRGRPREKRPRRCRRRREPGAPAAPRSRRPARQGHGRCGQGGPGRSVLRGLRAGGRRPPRRCRRAPASPPGSGCAPRGAPRSPSPSRLGSSGSPPRGFVAPRSSRARLRRGSAMGELGGCCRRCPRSSARLVSRSCELPGLLLKSSGPGHSGGLPASPGGPRLRPGGRSRAVLSAAGVKPSTRLGACPSLGRSCLCFPCSSFTGRLRLSKFGVVP